MDVRKFSGSYIPLISFIVFISAMTYLFFLRPPVILVTDVYSHALYGAEQEQLQIFTSSFRILRQVKVFRIMEETDGYTIAEAIKKARPIPRFVFFPFHYSEAAKIYNDHIKQEGNDATKTIVLFYEENQTKNKNDYISIAPDIRLDYYRTGRSAAILSREIRASREDNLNIHRQITFMYDTQANSEAQSAFEKGLQDGGYSGTARFVNARDMVDHNNLDCVVIEGPANAFLQSVKEIPAILLSWFHDTNYFPDNIKIQINDSPYALIPKVVGLPESSLVAGAVLKVPSSFQILRNKIVNKKLIGELSKAVRSEFGDNASR